MNNLQSLAPKVEINVDARDFFQLDVSSMFDSIAEIVAINYSRQLD